MFKLNLLLNNITVYTMLLNGRGQIVLAPWKMLQSLCFKQIDK